MGDLKPEVKICVILNLSIYSGYRSIDISLLMKASVRNHQSEYTEETEIISEEIDLSPATLARFYRYQKINFVV